MNHFVESAMQLLGLGAQQPPPRKGKKLSGTELAKITEQVVDSVDPKIRIIPRYEKKLRAPLSTALAYLDELVEQIPAPLIIAAPNPAIDPRLHLFFPNAQDMHMLFRSTPELMDLQYDLRRQGKTHSYVLLCMEKTEQTVFGMELHGSILKRDVRQSLVKFNNHLLLSPGATAAQAREGFRQCAFDGLLRKALEKIVMLNYKHKQLIKQRGELYKEHHLHKHSYVNENFFLANHETDYLPPDIKEVEQQLSDIKSQIASPQKHLDITTDILSRPEDFLTAVTSSFTLNRLGIKLSAGSEEPGYRIDGAELSIEDNIKRFAVILRLPNEGLIQQLSH